MPKTRTTTPPDALRVEILERIADIEAGDWNRLAGAAYPFLQHEFLHAAEATECVARGSGWEPRHLVLRAADGRAVAAMPLYEKTHSWGEFVFDWAWAQAYHRAGVEYFPKLVSAVPFTPAPSPRLLGDAEFAPRLLAAALELARDAGHSSLHVLFPEANELDTLRAAGLKLRKDCQFHWHNRDYRSFDDFLATFSSAKRKKARRDRRHVSEQGIAFRWLAGDALDAATWSDVYDLISNTFMRRGSMPYFDYDFFLEVSRRLPRQILVVLAERRNTPVAAAVFYVGADTLYGRYWGSDVSVPGLHFEACYYQGIEYCLREGLSRFEPGAQGVHKIARGFLPTIVRSRHWIADARFAGALRDWCADESAAVLRHAAILSERSPFRDAA